MRPRTKRAEAEFPPTVFCQLHPAAEEFEISIVDPFTFLASVNTSVLGPGYHVFMTSLLKDLAGEFRAYWEHPQDESDNFGDDTGYFFSGDEAALREEMAAWLAAVAQSFSDASTDSDSRGIALCMPVNPRFEIDSPALTPLGPRDQNWLRQTAENGATGTDFFAWWKTGLNAEYYLRRALTQMWTDVRWRPALNDSERNVLEDVASCLRQAYELDPGVRYPWAEWKQILELLDRKGAEAKLVTSRAQGQPIIGYRRGDISVTLPGGWTMRIPGSFSDFEADEEGDLCALDSQGEIWFTAYRNEVTSLGSFASVKKSTIQSPRPDYLIERDDYFAQANVGARRRETGEQYFKLSSSNLALGARAVCTILFFNPEQKDWAVETWRSIQPPSGNSVGQD